MMLINALAGTNKCLATAEAAPIDGTRVVVSSVLAELLHCTVHTCVHCMQALAPAIAFAPAQ